MSLDSPARILRRRSEIRSEIQRLTSRIQEAASQLSRLESESAYLDGMLEFGYRAESSPSLEPKVPPVALARSPDDSPKNPDRAVVASRSLELIAAARKPLSRKALFKRLKDEGLEVFGKNPLMVLSTMLWRERDRIIRIPGFGYWPVGKPYPPGHYFPDQTTQLGLTLGEPKDDSTVSDV
jgi:hypothetical protein